jgi:uncharacterized protein (TIGR03435 family)
MSLALFMLFGGLQFSCAAHPMVPTERAADESAKGRQPATVAEPAHAEGSLLEVRISDSHNPGLSIRRTAEGDVIDGIDLRDLLASAYETSPSQVRGIGRGKNRRLRIEIACKSRPECRQDLLKSAVQAALGFAVRVHTERADVLALRAPKGASPPPPTVSKRTTGVWAGGSWTGEAVTMKQVSIALSAKLERVVIDETGWGGQYDLHLTSPDSIRWANEDDLKSIGRQLGVEVMSTTAEVEIIEVTWE